MNELELIIQRMIDAGEPENNIASVIKEYESLKINEPGKITPPKEENQGVPVEENVTPEIQPTATELPSEDISSDLQGVKKDKKLQQEVLRKSMSSITGIPEALVPSIAAITSGVLNTAAGIGDFVEKFGYAPLAAIVKTGGISSANPSAALLEYEKIAKQNNLDLSEVTNAADLIDNLSVKKFDEQGNEKDIFGLIEEGNYSDAADLAVNQALGSAPSLALSIASPIYGSALLGMSTAGGEFEKELKERPSESISKIAGGSLLKGGIEFGSEFLGGKATRIIGRLDKTGVSKKIIKDFTSNFLEKSLKTTAATLGGSITEGLTEGVTALGQTFVDDKLYKDEIETNAYFRNAINGAVVGAIMGGPVAGGGRGISFTNINKNKAYEFIAPKKWRNEKIKIDRNIIEAKLNLEVAPLNKKKKFQNQIDVLKLQKENRIKDLNNAFDGLTKKELLKYTNNISIIDNAAGEINNGRYTKAQQNLAQQQLKKAADENEELVTPNLFDAEVEESISKELRATETLLERGENIKGVKPKELDIVELTREEAVEITKDQDAKFSDGFFLSKSKSKDDRAKLYVIPEVAIKMKATNVYAHEMLHYIMSKNFKTDNSSMQPLINSFKDYLSKVKVKDQNQGYILDRVQKRIDDNYTEKGKIKEGSLEEYMNVFSDLIANEKILIDESFTDKLKNTFKQYFNGIGLGNIELETGKDVFDFLRNYTKNVNSKNKLIKLGFVDPKLISKKLPKVESLDNIIKESRSQDASNKVQQIYEEQGQAGAMDIIDQFKPIVDKLVNKYRDVPGFEYELLKDEIETGKRGILDMIMEYTPEKAKGAPLAAYINTFLSRRAIEAANRILDTEFKLDVTEAKGVTDTTTTEEIIEEKEVAVADEIKSLRKEIGLSEDLVTKVKDAVVKTFGTKLPNPQDPKFRFELQKRFRTELKKPLSKFVGTRANFENFLRDNFEAIYNKMPQSLINRRFSDFAQPVLDENGKQLRERTAEGNKVFTKKKISKAEWIKYFLGSEVGSSTKGARKTAVVEGMAEEIAFDATMEVLNDPDVISKYQDIAGITGEVLPENFKSLIAKQVDRAEDFKFSKSLINDANVKYSLTQQELGRILFENTMTELADKFPELADSINNENFKRSYPKVFYTIVVPAFEKAINKSIKEGSIEQAEQVVVSFIKTFSRGTRTFSTKKGELNLTTNKALWENVIYPAIKGTGLSSKKKFNLLKSGNRSYIRYGESPVITLIDVTNKDTRNDILSGKISKEEVNIQNEKALSELKNIIFNIGRVHPGLALSIIKVNQKDQRTLFRNAARLNRIVQNYKGDTVYEHNPPVQYIFNKIVDYLSNPNKNKKESLINLLNTMEANLVPKDFAKIVDKKYKDKMPPKGVFRYAEALAQTNYTFDEGNFKFSKSLNKDFNKILEESTGVKWTERFSPAKARVMAKGKGKGAIFVPYSADDFVGLLYTTLAGKEKGNQQMDWYRENLLRPFSRGIQAYEAEKQRAMREWSVLKQRAKKDVPGGLKKENESGFTNEQSLRMYMWQKQGFDIPGINKGEVNNAIRAIKKNDKFKSFADTLMGLNPEGYPSPEANWIDGDITSDLIGYVNGAKRSEFLSEWKENKDIIFSEKNITKLRGLYGEKYVEALENILYRMEKGVNRKMGQSKQERVWMDWVNNSVGSIMFFNARSAVLQTLSTVNFINFSDNNPISAAAALANFGQYRKDFVKLFNSDFLKQRRSGLQTDISADEIAKATKGNETSPRALFNALLKIGFTPTQIADSFAIASGGATFYRNRIKKYKKEGLEQKEAEQEAFTDFQEIAEETQQSSRPDRVSMEQAGSLGRVVLAFANTPMQYARLQKKAALDLVNGRGDWKTNISKIAYYGVIQNIIFSALQSALFALLFDDEEEVDAKGKYYRIANSSADSLLRGTGVYGAAAATVKNVILEIINQSKKDRPDYTKAATAATSISPPINSKLRKLISAGNTFKYKQSREKVFTEGFSLDNPALLAAGKVISAGTNVPADRVVQKLDNIYTAMQPETELWQSIALSLGWTEWDLGMIESQTKKSKTPLRKGRKRIKRKSIKRKSIQ